MHETLDIPPGFERHYRKSPVTDPWEPLYSRVTEDAVVLGLVAARRPTRNSRGFVHGGLITRPGRQRHGPFLRAQAGRHWRAW